MTHFYVDATPEYYDTITIVVAHVTSNVPFLPPRRLSETRFPVEAMAAPIAPRRTIGVNLGQRWREYVRRR